MKKFYSLGVYLPFCGNTLACKGGCDVPMLALWSETGSILFIPNGAGDTDLLDTWGDARPDYKENTKS